MKNKYLLIIFLISSFFVNGQINTAEYQLKNGESIIYFDANWNVISNKNDAEFYRIYKQGPNNTSLGVVTDYFKSGQIQNTLERATFIDLNVTNNWVFDGKSIAYFNTGEKEIEFNYLSGLINGSHKTFYKSGNLRIVKNYEKGVLQGDWVAYHESGSLQQTVKYVNNKKEGEYKSFYESGSIKVISHYVNGLLQGEFIEYFESGEIEKVSHYVDDLRQGEFIEYFESGTTSYTCNYINDLQEGEYKIYYKSGKIRQIGNLKKSEIFGITKRYNEDGRINNTLEYEDGKLVQQIFFYDNGGKENVLDIVDDELNKVTSFNKLGEITTIANHYKSGERKYVSNYLNGALDGESIAYFKSGKVAVIKIYSNGDFKSTIVFDKFGNEMYSFDDSKKIVHTLYKDEENLYSTGGITEWGNSSAISLGAFVEIENANYAMGNIFEGNIYGSKSTNFKVAIEDGLGQYMLFKNHMDVIKGQLVFNGPFIKYYNSGTIKSKINFINDKKHGEEKFYDQSGDVAKTIKWNNGIKDYWNLECDNKNNCEYVFESYFNDTESTELEGWSLYENDDEWSFVTVDKDLMFKSKTDSGKIKSINLPISDNEDFQVTVLADWMHGVDNQWYGLIIGWKDWDNYIKLNITANGYYKVDIKIKGINLGMQDYEKLERVNLRGNIKLNIVRVQEKLLFSVNSKLVYSSDYSSLLGEQIGVFCSGKQTVIFDNFKAVKSNFNSIPNNSPYSEWAGNGSGIILTKNGFIATNNHVINNANYIEVEFNYQNEIKSFKAEVVRTDEINDLAIIRINDPFFTSLKSIPYNFKTRSSDVGQSVFALGYPKALTNMGKDIKFTDGKISSKSGYLGDITTYQTTTPIQSGNSGGPLFDFKGNLIAINSSKLTSEDIDNVSYSIKSIYLLTLIDALTEKVDLPSDTSISGLSLTNQIKILSNYVVLIKVR